MSDPAPSRLPDFERLFYSLGVPDEPHIITTEDGIRLVQRPDGRWAEIPPPGCPACHLAWPWDGSTG